MAEIKATTEREMRTVVRVRGHELVADEPESSGGHDEGPTPYDLLAASLATCKSMTLRFYANRENYPVERIEVTVTHKRVHAKDCDDAESTEGFIHRFDAEIRVVGSELTEAQREKLLDVAGRCPVAKTLSNEMVLLDRMVE